MENKKIPNSITIKMSFEDWHRIGDLCKQLNLDQKDYIKTTAKKAGLLIYNLTRCVICGTDKFPVPVPEDYL